MKKETWEKVTTITTIICVILYIASFVIGSNIPSYEQDNLSFVESAIFYLHVLYLPIMLIVAFGIAILFGKTDSLSICVVLTILTILITMLAFIYNVSAINWVFVLSACALFNILLFFEKRKNDKERDDIKIITNTGVYYIIILFVIIFGVGGLIKCSGNRHAEESYASEYSVTELEEIIGALEWKIDELEDRIIELEYKCQENEDELSTLRDEHNLW